MINLFFFSSLAFASLRRRSVALLLSGMLALSALAGLLVGEIVPLRHALDLLNTLYTFLVLAIFILPFRRYARLREIVAADQGKLTRLTTVLILIGAATFAINGFVFYSIITSGIADYELFKNTSFGTEFAYSLPISHSLISLASLLSPVAYPLLGLGFYYAHARRGKVSVVCFVLSLNMPLQGFTVFSRSWSVMYLYLLIAYLWYSIYAYSRRFRRKLVIVAGLMTLPIAVYLVDVTQNRFKTFQVDARSAVTNPQLYSLFYYYSQWNANGVTVMSNFYSQDAIQYGGSSNVLLPYFYDLFSKFAFGLDHHRENEIQMRARIWPDSYSWKFNGLVANLVFDFGYILTLFIALLYASVTRWLAPRSGKTSVVSYLNFGLVVTVPIFSMFGNYFAVLYYNLGIIYSLMIGSYLTFRLTPVRTRTSRRGTASTQVQVTP